MNVKIDKAALIKAVLSIVDCNECQYTNNVLLDNINEQIEKIDNTISSFQRELAKLGNPNNELNIYLEKGSYWRSEEKEALARKTADSFLGFSQKTLDNFVESALAEIDREHESYVESYFQLLASAGVNIAKDIDFDADKWHLNTAKVETMRAKAVKTLSRMQIEDVVLLVARTMLGEEVNDRGYLCLERPEFRFINTSQINDTICNVVANFHNPKEDYRTLI